MNKINITMLFAFIIFLFLIQLIGHWTTNVSVHTWYPSLVKPGWTPPNFLFAPVWTLLYLSMAFSIWLIWKTPTSKPKKTAYLFFAGQTFLNAIWPTLFFGLKSPVLGFIDIILLTGLILMTIIAFYKINRFAALLLIPYFLWVIYAAALNGSIFYLNRSV